MLVPHACRVQFPHEMRPFLRAGLLPASPVGDPSSGLYDPLTLLAEAAKC